jgi:hypothetical protein
MNENLIQSENYLLMDDDWKYCCAALIAPQATNNSNFDLNENTCDDVIFIPSDLSSQITLDYAENQNTPTYELVAR